MVVLVVTGLVNHVEVDRAGILASDPRQVLILFGGVRKVAVAEHSSSSVMAGVFSRFAVGWRLLDIERQVGDEADSVALVKPGLGHK